MIVSLSITFLCSTSLSLIPCKGVGIATFVFSFNASIASYSSKIPPVTAWYTELGNLYGEAVDKRIVFV